MCGGGQLKQLRLECGLVVGTLASSPTCTSQRDCGADVLVTATLASVVSRLFDGNLFLVDLLDEFRLGLEVHVDVLFAVAVAVAAATGR